MKRWKKRKILQQVHFRQTTLDESTFLVRKTDVSLPGDSDHNNQERPGSPHTRSKGVTDHRAEEGFPTVPTSPQPRLSLVVGDSRLSRSRTCKRAHPHQTAEYVSDTSDTDTAVTDQEEEESWSLWLRSQKYACAIFFFYDIFQSATLETEKRTPKYFYFSFLLVIIVLRVISNGQRDFPQFCYQEISKNLRRAQWLFGCIFY